VLARSDGAGGSAAVAAPGQGRAGAPPGEPHQDALEHLQQDARGEQKLRPGDGRVRLPPGRAQRAHCYHALGAVHATFKPLDGRFRDFIAIPRPTATSRCTRCCSGPTARRSKCRSAPRKWT
jgi:hypothetical protein